jgi:broad specificity phosphatase PhoE
MPLKLVLLRHAESVGNGAGCMEGRQSTPLTPRGWQQAKALGRSLAAQAGALTHLYCSPQLRAVQTLQGIIQGGGWRVCQPSQTEVAASLSLPQVQPGGEVLVLAPDSDAGPRADVPITWQDCLQEYDNGILAGLTWAEAQQAYPELCQRLETTLDWVPIPGAETWEAGRDRARSAVHTWLQHHGNDDGLWVITHHWILQQLIAVILGSDRCWGLAIPPTAVFEFWLDCDRWERTGSDRWNSELWQIKRFNDSSHLLNQI